MACMFIPKSLDGLMNRLIITNDDTDLLSKVSEYQVNRASRGVNYGSGTDVLDQDEFANATIEQRFTLQLLNNLLTPIKIFPISFESDSIVRLFYLYHYLVLFD